jgi:hypothetical protein
MSKLAVLGAGAALLLAATPVSAITIFADFTPATTDSNLSYSGIDDGTGTLTSIDQLVHFSFFNADGTTTGSTFDVLMNLTASTSAAELTAGGSIAALPVTSGSITFTSSAPITWNGHTGTNLLTVNFSGGALVGILGGSTATYGTSTPPYTVDFSSDFLDFSTSTARDLALAINAINPSVGFAFGGDRANFGSVSGNFGADVTAGNPQGVVPEPASWALMFAGFGLVGSVMRSQRRRTEVSFV